MSRVARISKTIVSVTMLCVMLAIFLSPSAYAQEITDESPTSETALQDTTTLDERQRELDNTVRPEIIEPTDNGPDSSTIANNAETTSISSNLAGVADPSMTSSSVTQAIDFASTDFIWTKQSAVSSLTRAKVAKPKNISKALLTITALDTEGARRHVFNAYVNGTEIGVGPNRRAGNTVYYNTFDVTASMTQSDNIIGVFSYSQAAHTGLLMQLTYIYADGHNEIVYNSGRDSEQTQIVPTDSVMYGTSGKSIGTAYYTDLAQHINTSAFPFAWQTVADFDGNPWATPRLIPLKSLGSGFTLSPAITRNTTRTLVKPASITNQGGGTYTITFAKEIIGDIQIGVSTTKAASVRVTMGEEQENGTAKYRMRTGNVYDETWQFMPGTTSFAGYGLKAFRYVTIYGYPGTLTQNSINGLETTIHDGSGNSNSFSASGSSLLNSIYALSKYTYKATTIDTVSDSVTRERRPYEGDNLIYQDLAFAMGSDGLAARNTWNFLMAYPTQYTEYRLMTVIGVYQDYLHTQDVDYVTSVYSKLKEALRVVKYDARVGLVRRAGSSVDLVDWPRTETTGYDFDATTYKSIINMFAYEAYRDFAKLAAITGHTNDAATFKAFADSIRKTLLSKLYDGRRHSFKDGLRSNGTVINHAAAQNSYVALMYGIYSSQSMADDIAKTITTNSRQPTGSIYSAYFYYTGLNRSGNGDLATAVLKSTSGSRTYHYVLNTLHATITPEAWSFTSKPNMTLSHPWGAGGGIALARYMSGIHTDDNGQFVINALGVDGQTVTSSMNNRAGSFTISIARSQGFRTINVTVPVNVTASIFIPRVSNASNVTLDGAATESGTIGFSDTGISLMVGAGNHVITVNDPKWNDADNKPAKAHGDTLAVRRGMAYYFKKTIAAGPADVVIGYGKPNDGVLTGDWDGDGLDTLVVRRQNAYYFKNSIAAGEADAIIAYGKPNDTVLVGDWDGDGIDTLAVRRNNVYYFKNSITSGYADTVIAYGKPTDQVLVGDWDGDGIDTLAVRRNNVYYFKNSITSGYADTVIGYGKATDTVLVGDWDADGVDTLAVRRQNAYYFKNSIASGYADTVIGYGKATDQVLVGKFF